MNQFARQLQSSHEEASSMPRYAEVFKLDHPGPNHCGALPMAGLILDRVVGT